MTGICNLLTSVDEILHSLPIIWPIKNVFYVVYKTLNDIILVLSGDLKDVKLLFPCPTLKFLSCFKIQLLESAYLNVF